MFSNIEELGIINLKGNKILIIKQIDMLKAYVR